MVLRGATAPELDRVVTRVFHTAARSSGCRLDAHREGDAFYIDIDLPGADPASIDVTADRAALTVRVERTCARREGLQLVAAGRPTPTISRQVFLSDTLDTDRLEARHDNGVLTLSIPVIPEPAADQELALAA
jgi:HSP20 family protein